MKILKLIGDFKSDILPLNVKLTIKKLKCDEQLKIFHCAEFVQNCISTLQTVKGKLSVSTYRALIKSTKLRKLHWELSDEDFTLEDIASFETNHSIKHLVIDEFDNQDYIPLNTLLQKFASLTSLKVYDCFPPYIRSSKIKSLWMYYSYFSENHWNQLRLNMPNLEHLQIYTAPHLSNDPDFFYEDQ